MEEDIKKIIENNIPDSICVFDGDSCNLKLTVTSKLFEDMSLRDQHKIIMKLLENHFQSGELHALSLETRSN